MTDYIIRQSYDILILSDSPMTFLYYQPVYGILILSDSLMHFLLTSGISTIWPIDPFNLPMNDIISMATMEQNTSLIKVV